MIVVGLGAMGAATAYQLARRGVSIVGIDRFAPPHELGSSHGETRITREAIGEGADYVPLVLRAHQTWRELEAATGEELFVACGGVVLGSPTRAAPMHDSSFLQTTIDVAKQYDIAHELLSPGELALRYRQFTGLADDEVAYFEPGAGFVRPEACVRTQLAEAERLGARIIRDAVVTSVAAGEVRTVHETFGAAHVVVAAGAWTAKLLGNPIASRLRVTRQTLHWFAVDEPALYTPDRFPIFIRIHGPNEGDSYYGFPTPHGGHGVKVATESFDVTTDPDRPASAPEDSDTFYDKHLAGLLRGVRRKRLAATTCLYTNTRVSRFIIAPHPATPSITMISACSGHGFKHSAGVGELVAKHIAEGTALPQAFALNASADWL